MFWKENDTQDIQQLPSVHQGDGSIKIRGFFDQQSRLPIRFQVWELAPSVSEGAHTHNNLEELYYFTAGSGVMTLDGSDTPVTAGDAVLAPPGCKHEMRNTGNEPLKVVLVWGTPE